MVFSLAAPAMAREGGTPPTQRELEQNPLNRLGNEPISFNALPDDYDEDGIPIFYVTVSPEEWARTFLNHPFFQGVTAYEDANFILAQESRANVEATSAIAPRTNWCSNCGQRQQVLESRWVIGATRQRNCPQFTVTGGASNFLDILIGRTWESREVCNACGWATHPWGSGWWIDHANEHLWSWTIDCRNNAATGIVNVIVGGAFPRHRPHQAVSFRAGSGASNRVHGHNCQAECGQLCR